MERVRRALKRAKLEKYVQAFEETGYDRHEILAMEEQALEALVTRVRFSARARFRGVVARARERKRIDDDEEMIENDCVIASKRSIFSESPAFWGAWRNTALKLQRSLVLITAASSQ